MSSLLSPEPKLHDFKNPEAEELDKLYKEYLN